MLNVGVLPHHKRWGDFLANLGWVVVDEAHTYRGVFGSHVANVLRRLRRVARLYGAEPRFVLASATIANPGELAERLTGLPFELLDDDGAPRAGREIGMWNPPVIEQRTMTRRSPVSEAADLLVELVSRGVRTICFMRSRRGIELINRFASTKLARRRARAAWPSASPPTAPATRRSSAARSSRSSPPGDLLAVAATDALELGIDVGELDAAICVNFPGTVASLRQMWGRAGRRSAAGSPSTSRARTRSTSSSAATPTSSSSGRSRRRSSTTAPSRSRCSTCSRPPTRRRSGPTTTRSSARAGGSGPSGW